jgi:hypothetical protein
MTGAAFAQTQVSFDEPVGFAGTYSFVRGQMVEPAPSLAITPGVIYNNTCPFSGGNFFFAVGGTQATQSVIDDGRVPSATSPAPNAGTLNSYWVTEFQISYVTRELATPAGPGASVNVDFYEDADVCVAPGPATASYVLTGLPGATAQGTAIGWTVNIDLTGGGEFIMKGDANGVYDGSLSLDTFGYQLAMPNQVGPGTQGFFLRGDTIAPGNCGVGDSTYYKNPLAPNGTGLDNQDAALFVPVGCSFFGGESAANPRGAFHMRMTADLNDCNNNKQSDAADIFLGSSDDTNNNGVPDECDPAECWMVAGRGAGSATAHVDGWDLPTQLSNVVTQWEVTMDDFPAFAMPTRHQGNSGLWKVDRPMVMSVQVLMYNPEVFPDNPTQWSQRLDVYVAPNEQPIVSWNGTLNGVHINYATFVGADGKWYVHFPFAIDGL